MAKPVVVALLPVRRQDAFRDGEAALVRGEPLLARSIAHAKAASSVSRIVVTTESEAVADLALRYGAEIPFRRPETLARKGIPMEDVLRHAVRALMEDGFRPDIVLLLEVSHPFRPPHLLDELVSNLISRDLDTVFCVVEERDPFWQLDDEGNLHRVDQNDRDTRATRTPLYREIGGLGLATRLDVILGGDRLGRKVGVVAVPPTYALVDTETSFGLDLARALDNTFFKEDDG